MPKLKIQKAPTLGRISWNGSHTFSIPIKCINEGTDVPSFLTSHAHSDIMTFLLQLTASMFPQRRPDGSVQAWELDHDSVDYPPHVSAVRSFLATFNAMIDQHPPDTGPRRFGNVAFRGWFDAVEGQSDQLLQQLLSDLALPSRDGDNGGPSADAELKAYLMGSWGSAQRLDYGTGHELSLLAFLGCLWKLGAFKEETAPDGVAERAIVLGIIAPYLTLTRRLIQTYTLEPAGSHGVWGLDDHFFLPYIFGSAQLSPGISDLLHIPLEGSLPGAPSPGGVTKEAVVTRYRENNFYFGAIGFIYDVKKGPFWEHSPVLYDISGVTAGWAKINKGMIKMYNAEVLSKFPVVQHFPFGSLFRWEQNPAAIPSTATPHVASHAQSRGQATPATNAATAAPWAPPPSMTGFAGSTNTVRNGQFSVPTRKPYPPRLSKDATDVGEQRQNNPNTGLNANQSTAPTPSTTSSVQGLQTADEGSSQASATTLAP